MKTAIYARTSTKEKQEVRNQLEQLRRYGKRRRWKLVGEYVDRESGASSGRTEFRRLFEDAYRGRFDVVLFWDLSRFSREGVLKTLQHLQRLSDYGVKWKSLTQEYLDSTGPFGDALVALLAALAQQERETIQRRIKAGMERAKKEGRRMGRPRKVFDRKRVFRLREKGLSYRAIAVQMKIGHSTVGRILSEAG